MFQFPRNTDLLDHGVDVQHHAEGEDKQELVRAWLVHVVVHVLDQVMKQDHAAHL